MHALRALAFLALVLSSICHAHQDRIIEIQSDGTLVGIPAQFGPGSMHVSFTRGNSRAPISSIDLTLGNRKTHLPICVTGVINSVRLEDIIASASWYHDEKLLPYYLNVEFFDPGYNAKSEYNSGYSLLFNLRTARLIEMNVLIARNKGKSRQRLPLDLAAMCSKSEYERFKDARS